MKEKWRDFLWGMGFALLGAAILIFMPLLVTGKYSTEAGPTIFPSILAWGMLLIGTILAAGSLIGYLKLKKDNTQQEAPFFQKLVSLAKAEWKVVVFMTMALLYVLLYQKLGYFVVSIVMGTLLLILFSDKKKSHYVAVYVAIILIYVGFRFGLSAMLPQGSWFGL